MKGSVLHYDMSKSEGVIITEDSQRYKFINSEWKESSLPQKGMAVEFLIEGSEATEIYLGLGQNTLQSQGNDWYKSSDDKVLAGVCAGIGHKHNVSISALRIVTVITSIFFIVPLILYIVLWVLLDARSTRVI